MCEDTFIYEPYWIDPLSEQLVDILDDRNMSIEQLSELTGVPLYILQDFVNGKISELSSDQYHQIETSLDLPNNYFARCKAMYAERAAKLAQTA